MGYYPPSIPVQVLIPRFESVIVVILEILVNIKSRTPSFVLRIKYSACLCIFLLCLSVCAETFIYFLTYDSRTEIPEVYSILVFNCIGPLP